MSDRIELQFGANTTDVERGADRMADSLDDTSDKLDDLGRTGEEAGQKAADGLDDAGESAEGVGDKLGDLGGVAKDALEGDFAGAAEGAIQSVSRLAGVIPGIGALIGGVFATIGGSIINHFSEAAEQSEERIRSMYDDMIASGNAFLSEDLIQKKISEIINDAGQLDKVREDAATLGLNVETLLGAAAGRAEDLSAVFEASAQKVASAKSDLAPDETLGDRYADLGSLNEVTLRYEQIAGDIDTAAAKSKLFKDATSDASTEVDNLSLAMQSVKDKTVTVKVDTVGAEAALKRFQQRQRDITVGVRYKSGKPVLQ